MPIRFAAVLALLLLLLLATGPIAAAAARFSFRAVEFEPAEQRLPYARAFVAWAAAPGTSVPVAVAALRRAGTKCRSTAGTVTCRASRSVARSDLDTGVLDDVTWTVRLARTPDGRVASATVERTNSGE